MKIEICIFFLMSHIILKTEQSHNLRLLNNSKVSTLNGVKGLKPAYVQDNNMKQYYVYIATNKRNTVLYTGITDNLARRMYQHKHKSVKGFTSQYNINKLVYFHKFNSPGEAIAAEKKIKGWTREKKINLIKSINPAFKDLVEEPRDPSGQAPQDDHFVVK